MSKRLCLGKMHRYLQIAILFHTFVRVIRAINISFLDLCTHPSITNIIHRNITANVLNIEMYKNTVVLGLLQHAVFFHFFLRYCTWQFREGAPIKNFQRVSRRRNKNRRRQLLILFFPFSPPPVGQQHNVPLSSSSADYIIAVMTS